MDTRDVLIVNPTGSDQVDPDYPKSEEKLKEWFSSHNPAGTIIATGFIASTADDVPTTLKRDGSDFSAAILGALVHARQVTIWTDVDGVYSADPRKGLSLSLSLCGVIHILYMVCWGCLHRVEGGNVLMGVSDTNMQIVYYSSDLSLIFRIMGGHNDKILFKVWGSNLNFFIFKKKMRSTT